MSAKPKRVLFNNEDEEDQLPELPPGFGARRNHGHPVQDGDIINFRFNV
jgi:hypothetical protein